MAKEAAYQSLISKCQPQADSMLLLEELAQKNIIKKAVEISASFHLYNFQ